MALIIYIRPLSSHLVLTFVLYLFFVLYESEPCDYTNYHWADNIFESTSDNRLNRSEYLLSFIDIKKQQHFTIIMISVLGLVFIFVGGSHALENGLARTPPMGW